MTDLKDLIEYCSDLCSELTRVNNAVFNKTAVNDYDFSFWFQENKICEVKIYYAGCRNCSIFTFSYSDEPCIYLNHEEIERQDFVLGGKAMRIMQTILDELINLNREDEQ